MLIYIKTKNEIEEFRKAGKIAADILSILLSNVRENITTNDLNNIALEQCKRFNVKPTFLGYLNYPAAICTSINKELVHGIPSERILKNGDILKIDIGVTLPSGCIGDTAETIIVGNEDNRLIMSCRRALYAAISVVKAGNELKDIGRVVSNIAISEGFNVPIGYGGHGIDPNYLHADPFVANYPDDRNIKLRAGMILAIEPMLVDGDANSKILNDKWTIKVNGLASHCEHTVLVTEQGADILTKRG